MSEALQHQSYNSTINTLFHGDMLSPKEQAHELAADISRFGAAALASEIVASQTTGTPTTVEVPNPVNGKMLKPGLKISLESEGKRFSWEGDRRSLRAQASITETQSDLDHFMNTGPEATTELAVYIEDRLRPQPGSWLHNNDAMVLAGADLPPLLKDSRDKVAREQGLDPARLKIEKWLSLSSSEQKLNFAQWYNERLKVLSSPESREAFVSKLKGDYIDNAHKAMADGWIDPRYERILEKRMAKTDVLFFSPFGSVAKEFGGANQGDKKLIALPTLTGSHIVNHEFGHSFAGIDPNSMGKHFIKTLGKEGSKRQAANLFQLYTILNEGFDEHMTIALLSGSPEIVNPAARTAAGLPEVQGASDLYEDYREVFAALIGGANGKIERSDIKTVVDTMVEGNYDAFNGFLDTKWDGRDVLSETLKVIADFNIAQKQNPNDPSFSQEALVENILNYLHIPAVASV